MRHYFFFFIIDTFLVLGTTNSKGVDSELTIVNEDDSKDEGVMNHKVKLNEYLLQFCHQFYLILCTNIYLFCNLLKT